MFNICSLFERLNLWEIYYNVLSLLNSLLNKQSPFQNTEENPSNNTLRKRNGLYFSKFHKEKFPKSFCYCYSSSFSSGATFQLQFSVRMLQDLKGMKCFLNWKKNPDSPRVIVFSLHNNSKMYSNVNYYAPELKNTLIADPPGLWIFKICLSLYQNIFLFYFTSEVSKYLPVY